MHGSGIGRKEWMNNNIFIFQMTTETKISPWIEETEIILNKTVEDGHGSLEIL